jgi:hypothetical protein
MRSWHILLQRCVMALKVYPILFGIPSQVSLVPNEESELHTVTDFCLLISALGSYLHTERS